MSSTRDQWESLDDDPDLTQNLGYELEDWETTHVDQCRSDHYVFVSTREDKLDREEYIIAESDAVCNLLDRR